MQRQHMGDKRVFLIGDAGGTGTQWRLVLPEGIHQFETVGFNSYTHDLQDFKTSIIQSIGSDFQKTYPVYLYASGVATKEQKVELKHGLREILGDFIHVENDLVGVARGLCLNQSGNACILGTGSNACYYNGTKVSTVSASLGYVLGDEGSGAYLGAKLIMRVFREQLSEDITQEFHQQYNLTSHDVIQRIYHKPRPNEYLASFAPFLSSHKNHPEIYQLIYDAFTSFFKAFFFKKKHLDVPFHFSGSIAYYFADILRQVATDLGYNTGKIVASPIAGLVLYHQNNE